MKEEWRNLFILSESLGMHGIVKLSDICLAKTFFKPIFYPEAVMAIFWLNKDKCRSCYLLHFSMFGQTIAIITLGWKVDLKNVFAKQMSLIFSILRLSTRNLRISNRQQVGSLSPIIGHLLLIFHESHMCRAVMRTLQLM